MDGVNTDLDKRKLAYDGRKAKFPTSAKLRRKSTNWHRTRTD